MLVKNRSFLVTLGGLLLTPALHATTVTVIDDGTFSPANYAVMDSVSGPGYFPGTGTATQVTTGGDPGDFQEDVFETSTVPATSIPAGYPPYYYDAREASINLVDSYDPATEGAILDVNFSADLKSDTAGDPAFDITFYAEQNGYLYHSVDLSTSDISSSWTLYTDSESDSSAFTYPASITHPGLDFSSAGAPIYFGIGVSYLDSSPSTNGFDLDNLKVTVDSANTIVPEPMTWGLLLVGQAMMALRRRMFAATR